MAERPNVTGDLLDFPRSTDAFRPALSDASGRPVDLPPPSLLAGTLTFLLTDIEGSTRRWEAHGPEMTAAVARHYEILDAAITGHGGVRPIEQGEGDSLVAAFAHASDAIRAALDGQRALSDELWPEDADITVRMALHTGEAQIGTGASTPARA
jgi:class 3 adenylate cyclase